MMKVSIQCGVDWILNYSRNFGKLHSRQSHFSRVEFDCMEFCWLDCRYTGVPRDKAIEDFRQRIKHFAEVYESLDESDAEQSNESLNEWCDLTLDSQVT
jgi:hypothetical protein